MHVRALDHIVLCVKDVAVTCRFYRRVLGMEPREERPGKWSLHFGANKISLQDAGASPDIARHTVPGSGNFCVLTDTPINDVVAHLETRGDRDRRRSGRAGRRDRPDPVGLLQGSGWKPGGGQQPALAGLERLMPLRAQAMTPREHDCEAPSGGRRHSRTAAPLRRRPCLPARLPRSA